MNPIKELETTTTAVEYMTIAEEFDRYLEEHITDTCVSNTTVASVMSEFYDLYYQLRRRDAIGIVDLTSTNVPAALTSNHIQNTKYTALYTFREMSYNVLDNLSANIIHVAHFRSCVIERATEMSQNIIAVMIEDTRKKLQEWQSIPTNKRQTPDW